MRSESKDKKKEENKDYSIEKIDNDIKNGKNLSQKFSSAEEAIKYLQGL